MEVAIAPSVFRFLDTLPPEDRQGAADCISDIAAEKPMPRKPFAMFPAIGEVLFCDGFWAVCYRYSANEPMRIWNMGLHTERPHLWRAPA